MSKTAKFEVWCQQSTDCLTTPRQSYCKIHFYGQPSTLINTSYPYWRWDPWYRCSKENFLNRNQSWRQDQPDFILKKLYNRLRIHRYVCKTWNFEVFVWKLIFKHYKTHFVFLQNKLKKMCFLFLFISILCNNRNLYKTMYSIYSPSLLLMHFKDSSNWLQTSRNGWHHHWLWHYWMGLIIQWCPLLKTLCSKTRKIPLKSCVLMAYIVPQARVGWWWWHQHHQWCFCCEAPIGTSCPTLK